MKKTYECLRNELEKQLHDVENELAVIKRQLDILCSTGNTEAIIRHFDEYGGNKAVKLMKEIKKIRARLERAERTGHFVEGSQWIWNQHVLEGLGWKE